MTWHLTADVDEFHRVAGDYLARDPARRTALLTVSEMVRRHGPYAYGDTEPARFGWWREGDGPVGAAFLQTAPRPPLLAPMPEHLARALAQALRAGGVPLRGVKGGEGSTQAFADEWAGRGGWTVALQLRLFRLGELTPQHPAPPGAARQATAVTRSALDAGAEQVLLFTDLANSTSNALYQRLGYRPLADYVDLEFN